MIFFVTGAYEFRLRKVLRYESELWLHTHTSHLIPSPNRIFAFRHLQRYSNPVGTVGRGTLQGQFLRPEPYLFVVVAPVHSGGLWARTGHS